MHLFSSSQRRVLILALLLVVSICLAVSVGAQSTTGTGSIQGTVTDQSGSAVFGAKVTITNKATGAASHFTTSATGTYASGPLQPGSYTVRVESKGFKTVALALNVEVGIATAGSARLQPGPENQIVDIQGSDMAVNTEQATVQSVLRPNQISAFPVNGRNFMDAAQLVPGVQEQDGSTFDPTKNGFSSVSFLSRYGRTARILLDGADISDETVGTTTQNIPVSAIQEVNLSQSLLDVSTELTSTGEVNLTTRSGSNDLHGEGFGLFRSDQVAAHLPGLVAPTFEREQFGGRLGGYIIKDKLFWFLAAERTMQDFTSAEPFSAPFNLLNTSLAQPFREFQADGRLDWFSPQHGHAFLRFLFDQNNQTRPYGSASSVQAFENENHTPSGTVGYDFTKGNYNHSFRFAYLRFRNGIVDSTGTIPAGVNNPVPGLGINIGASVAGSCLLSGGGAYCGGPNYLAPQKTFQSDLQFRYDGSRVWGNHVLRFGGTYNRIQSGVFAAFVTFPQAGSTSICLPTSTPGNCLTTSDPTAYPAQSVFLGNGVGFPTPNSAFGMPGGGLGPDNRFEGYVGDTWKVKPTLSLTYGLRYVRDTGRVDSNLGPEPALNLWQPGLGAQVRTPNDNFAPQFGFVWDASGGGKTVVRGGAGLYYENSIWNNVLFDSPARRKQGIFAYTPQVCSAGVPSPFTWPTNPGGVGTLIANGAGAVVTGTDQVQPTFCGGAISAVAAQFLALSSAFQAATASAGAQANPNFVGTSLNAANANGFDLFAPNYRTPRSWQMNFGFEHEFRPGTVLSLDLIRNVGLHFLLGIDQNHSGAARSYNMANALAARDRAQVSNGCPPGVDQANCMVLRLGQAGGKRANWAEGLA